MFFLLFCFIIEGFETGSVPRTNGSGSVRPKNIRIRFRNPATNTMAQSYLTLFVHCFLLLAFEYLDFGLKQVNLIILIELYSDPIA
jgi:hypothetical protein